MIYVFVAIGVFLLMEPITWATHKYVMHGFLWYLHEDHHQKSDGFFEKNDYFLYKKFGFDSLAHPNKMMEKIGLLQANSQAGRCRAAPCQPKS